LGIAERAGEAVRFSRRLGMNRIPWLALPVLVLLVLPARSEATSCSCEGSFLENAKKADLVIRGMPEELVGQWGNGAPRYAKIRVVEVFKGEPPADFIVVEGDDGMSLRPYASEFHPFTGWLLALNLSHEISKDGKKAWIYHVSVCGSHALKIEKETVLASRGCPEPDSGAPLGEYSRRLAKALQAGE
jgi:hypothetical protein